MNEVKLCENNEINHLMKNILNNALKEIMSAVKAECGSLYLFDLENKELVLDTFHNSANLFLKGLRQKIGEGISGTVANIKTPVLVKDISRDRRFHKNGFSHYKTNSFISIPLFSSGVLLGLINLADKNSGEPFSEEDLEFAATIAKYACMNIDISHNCAELKREKEALDKQKSLLEKYASVGKLAAGVVHEINNPLDGILRYTNILIKQLEENHIAREYLLEVKTGLNRIANITKSLLEFSHLANSGSAKEKKYIDINQLIDDSLDLLSRELEDIKIKKEYKESLPKIIDFGLQRVFVNIIKNALDAMPGGGTLEISQEVRDSSLAITFKDSGTGIPHEVKNRIFEPFFTTKEINKGTGLGLSICNEIINKYEGRIEVHSSSGEGSRFTVLIPSKYLENA
jgi:signal transduction histidine kinase